MCRKIELSCREDLGDFRNAKVKMKAAVLGDQGKCIAYVGCLLVSGMDSEF